MWLRECGAAAELFVGRLRRAKADLPATFDVPGGTIEVDLSLYGVSRMHVVDAVRELVGTFTSPIQLPAWLTTAITLAGVTAAVERALMLRRHPVVDAETIWTNF